MKSQINIIRIMSIIAIISLVVYCYFYNLGEAKNVWEGVNAIESISLSVFGGALIAVIIAFISYFAERYKALETYFNQLKRILEHARNYPKGNVYDEKVDWFNTYKDLMVSFYSQASCMNFIIGIKCKEYLKRIAQYYNEFILLTQNAFLFIEKTSNIPNAQKNDLCTFIDSVIVEVESVKLGILINNTEFIKITHDKELVLKNVNEIWKASFRSIFKHFKFEQTLVTQETFQLLDDETEKYVKKIIKMMDKRNTCNIEIEIPENICKKLKDAGYLYTYRNKAYNIKELSCQFIIYHYFELKKQLEHRENIIGDDAEILNSSNESVSKIRPEKSIGSDLLILMLTTLLIPMIAHTLDIIMEEANAWSSERMLTLYFAAVSGYVISEKIFYLLKKKNLYQRGIRLGDSDAIPIFLSTVPTLFVIVGYETVLGIIVLLIFACISVGILLFANEGILFTKEKFMVLVGFVILVIIVFNNLSNKGTIEMWVFGAIRYAAILFIVCLAFDVVHMVLRKLKNGKDV